MTIRYFRKIKKRIEKLEWLYDEDADTGVISGSITFKDGSIFHFKEVLLGENRYYRLHYMDERSKLISRWDSAPHYRKLKTFPYHVHLPNGVKESERVTLIDVLDKVQFFVITKLESNVG